MRTKRTAATISSGIPTRTRPRPSYWVDGPDNLSSSDRRIGSSEAVFNRDRRKRLNFSVTNRKAMGATPVRTEVRSFAA